MRPPSVLTVTIILFAAADLRAAVLTFDEIAPHLAAVPDGYGGLNWHNMSVLDVTRAGASGYENGVTSGDWVAFNESALVATLSSGLFDFRSAALTAAWNDGLEVRVEGFAGGVLAFSRTVAVDTAGPTWVQFDFFGIDSLTFTSSGGVENPAYVGGGEHFVLDDFHYDRNPPIVPEPGTLVLMGLGVAGISLRRLRSRVTSGLMVSGDEVAVHSTLCR